VNSLGQFPSPLSISGDLLDDLEQGVRTAGPARGESLVVNSQVVLAHRSTPWAVDAGPVHPDVSVLASPLEGHSEF